MEKNKKNIKTGKQPKSGVSVPIGVKLITVISFIMIVALFTITFVSIYYFKADSEIRIREYGLNISRAISENVETKFNTIAENAMLIADDILPSGTDSNKASPDAKKELETHKIEHVESMMKLFFSNNENMIFVGVAENKDGKVVLLNGVINPNYQASGIGYNKETIEEIVARESEMFAPAFKGQQNVHNSSPSFNEPVTGIGIPAEKDGSPVPGLIIIVYISLQEFMDTVDTRDINVNYIVNSQGDLIVHPDRALTDVQTNLMNLRVVTEMTRIGQNNGQIMYTDDSDGIEYISSFSKVNFGGLAVITTVSSSDAFQMVYQLMRRNIYISVIVLCLAILVVYFFAKTIVTPVQRLAAATKKIEEGNFNIKLKAASRDEIGLLTRAFVAMSRGLAERQKIKEAFGKFVNKSVADMVLKNEVKLGGEMKEAVILFSDIRSFTMMSETMPPTKVVDFLNGYMTDMVDCVNKAGGVVDKFIGDAIMATWGTPVSTGNDTENAINAALMMRKALFKFNAGRGTKDKPRIRIGCGINTGTVLAGQIGSMDRMEYTVIGDTVNVASRIESLTKVFGTDILVSETSYRMVQSTFYAVPMQQVPVKGKKDLQQTYAIIGRRDDPACPRDLDDVRRQIGMDERMIAEYNTVSLEKRLQMM